MGINKNDIVKHEQMTTSEKRHRRFSISSSSFTSFTFNEIIVQKEIVSFVATKTERPFNQFHLKSKRHQLSIIDVSTKGLGSNSTNWPGKKHLSVSRDIFKDHPSIDNEMTI
jgi:hypothetical protein